MGSKIAPPTAPIAARRDGNWGSRKACALSRREKSSTRGDEHFILSEVATIVGAKLRASAACHPYTTRCS